MPAADQEEENRPAMEMTRCQGRRKSARWDGKGVVENKGGLVLVRQRWLNASRCRYCEGEDYCDAATVAQSTSKTLSQRRCLSLGMKI